MVELGIIIVNWNSGEQRLLNCIESINRSEPDVFWEITVFDNGSTDDSLQKIEGIPNTRIIRSNENLGFAKACNRAASQAHQQLLLFLNPDTLLNQGVLSRVREFMCAPENYCYAIAGVQLKDDQAIARSCCRIPKVRQMFAHVLGLDRIRPEYGYVMKEWDHKNTQVVEHVIGAFYMVRNQVFGQLGGFDERFYVYLEDLDFSARVANQGYQCIYLADVNVYHEGGGVSKQVQAKRLFYALRSRILYAFKHFDKASAVCILIATLAIEPVIRIAAGIRSMKTIRNTASAYRDLYQWLLFRLSKGYDH